MGRAGRKAARSAAMTATAAIAHASECRRGRTNSVDRRTNREGDHRSDQPHSDPSRVRRPGGERRDREH